MTYKVAVLLPETYRGGTLRGALNIVKMLVLGAKSAGDKLELSFGHVDSPSIYNDSDFEELRRLGVKVRPFFRELIDASKLEPIFSFLGLPNNPPKGGQYWCFNDGISNFEDCDFWIIISDRIQHPIPINRPYAVVVYDYIQRYVPAIFGETTASVGNWKMFDAYAQATRDAQFVICTTEQTRRDCINYAGVNADRVFKFPLEFDPLKNNTPNRICGETPSAPYLLWTTNSTQHKNHLNVIIGLGEYFRLHPESDLEIYVTGVYTHLFSDKGSADIHFMNEYVIGIRKAIEDSPEIKKRMRILGNLSDDVYLEMLQSAHGVLHGALYDNGTYSMIEAAWMGVPSISSDYPAIREICEVFGLNPILFNPHKPADLALGIQKFEDQYLDLCSKLPNRQKLQSRTFNVVAPEYWRMFLKALDVTKILIHE